MSPSDGDTVKAKIDGEWRTVIFREHKLDTVCDEYIVSHNGLKFKLPPSRIKFATHQTPTTSNRSTNPRSPKSKALSLASRLLGTSKSQVYEDKSHVYYGELSCPHCNTHTPVDGRLGISELTCHDCGHIDAAKNWAGTTTNTAFEWTNPRLPKTVLQDIPNATTKERL